MDDKESTYYIDGMNLTFEEFCEYADLIADAYIEED